MTDRGGTRLTLLAAAALMGVVVSAAIRRPGAHDRLLGSVPITFQIDPNTADRDTLCLLPGIAAGKARAIIDEREAHGPYRSAADLERASGIGIKTRQGFEPWIGFEVEASSGD